jgi:hypothetical protein
MDSFLRASTRFPSRGVAGVRLPPFPTKIVPLTVGHESACFMSRKPSAPIIHCAPRGSDSLRIISGCRHFSQRHGTHTANRAQQSLITAASESSRHHPLGKEKCDQAVRPPPPDFDWEDHSLIPVLTLITATLTPHAHPILASSRPRRSEGGLAAYFAGRIVGRNLLEGIDG